MRSSPSSVAPILTSKRSESGALRVAVALSLLVALSVACGASSFETVTELPETPRRAPGVVIEPSPALPPAEYRAPVAAVVTLLERPSDDGVESLVKAFVRALASADVVALRALTTHDFSPFDMGRDPSRASRWAARAQRFQQQRIAGIDVVEHCAVDPSPYDEVLSYDGVRSGEGLARVTVDTSGVASAAWVRESFLLVLRVESGGLRVAGEVDAP